MPRLKLTIRAVALGALISCAIAACATPSAMADSAAAPDAIGSVKSVVDETFVVFKDNTLAPAERERKLRAIAERHFDFQQMAQSAIGYHWRTFTPAQKTEFVPLFTAFVEDAYLSRIESYSVRRLTSRSDPR